MIVPGYDPEGWLDDALKRKPGVPVIILHHRPVIGGFYNNSMHPNWPEKAGNEWNSLLNSHSNIVAIICSHFHRDELHWIAGIPVYVCPPVVTYFGRQTCLRVYEYSGGRLSYRTVYIE